jgi:hypothetical protein
MAMNNKINFKSVVSSLIMAAGLLGVPAPSYSEDMGERIDDRQEKRDINQEGREVARDVKAACKEGDQSRSECRQEKRDIKQKSRDAGRAVKHD